MIQRRAMSPMHSLAKNCDFFSLSVCMRSAKNSVAHIVIMLLPVISHNPSSQIDGSDLESLLAGYLLRRSICSSKVGVCLRARVCVMLYIVSEARCNARLVSHKSFNGYVCAWTGWIHRSFIVLNGPNLGRTLTISYLLAEA